MVLVSRTDGYSIVIERSDTLCTNVHVYVLLDNITDLCIV